MSEKNEDQKKFWNGPAGDGWVAGQESMDASMSFITDKLFSAANVQAGERVVDIGCGTGQTSLLAAEKVGDAGHVLGLDISEPMLAHARDRASSASQTNVAFTTGDAQVDRFEADRTLVMSRFGVMFFEDPVAAFSNIHAHMKEGGRLCFACWQSPLANEWLLMPMQVARKHIPADSPPDPHAPGPFAFADMERVKGILEEAGWSNVRHEGFSFDFPLGQTVDGAVSGLLERGPLRSVLAEASDEIRAAVTEEVKSNVPEPKNGNPVCLEGAIWIVQADA